MTDTASDISVLYEDNHVLLVNKPAGIPTQPSDHSSESLEDRAKAWIKIQRNKPGNVYLHAVHRLDRVVSGVVLFACTDKALSRLNAQARDRKMLKLYHAVVQPGPKKDSGQLRNFLKHGHLKALIASGTDKEAKEALLRYRVLSRSGNQALLEVDLETGRYHQIRIQLSTAGFPIVGDGLYGGTGHLAGGGIALHHAILEFEHPVKKERLRIEAPYPADWPAEHRT